MQGLGTNGFPGARIRAGLIAKLAMVAALVGCGANAAAPLAPGMAKLAGTDATQLAVHRWPVAPDRAKAVVLIVHGASEQRRAPTIGSRGSSTSMGYAVYAMDLRGHGQTRLRSGRAARRRAPNRVEPPSSRIRSGCAT